MKKRCKQEKETLKMALTYVPTPEGGSIIGDERLNFRVRNGAGCDPLSKSTTKREKAIAMIFSLLAETGVVNIT